MSLHRGNKGDRKAKEVLWEITQRNSSGNLSMMVGGYKCWKIPIKFSLIFWLYSRILSPSVTCYPLLFQSYPFTFSDTFSTFCTLKNKPPLNLATMWNCWAGKTFLWNVVVKFILSSTLTGLFFVTCSSFSIDLCYFYMANGQWDTKILKVFKVFAPPLKRTQ